MPTRIPLPGDFGDSFLKGLDSGGTLFQRIMQPKIEREKLQQQQQQFLQNLALRKQAMARAGANSDLQRQILQQNLIKMQHANDPMWEFNQLKNMESFFGGNAQQNQEEMPSMPTQEMGEGMGMFSPEGLQEAQQQPQQPQGGLNLDMFRQHPMLRGWAKKHLGYDPLAGESNVLHGPARDAADLAKLKKDAEAGLVAPEVYQDARAAYDAQVDAKKDLRDLRARTKEGLKVGEKLFFDPESGQPLGKEIPLTAKERESEEGNILFNELYPYVYKGGAPLSGEGSITRLEQAAANYKTDPKARKLIDDYLLAEKMLAATTVNEASTLKSGKTNTTYKMLKESLEAQDIPKVVKKLIKQYGIPASAQLKASMRYQKVLSDARKKARKGTPATQKLFYNPEMQAQYEDKQNEIGASKLGAKVINGVTYYPDGQGGWEHD